MFVNTLTSCRQISCSIFEKEVSSASTLPVAWQQEHGSLIMNVTLGRTCEKDRFTAISINQGHIVFWYIIRSFKECVKHPQVGTIYPFSCYFHESMSRQLWDFYQRPIFLHCFLNLFINESFVCWNHKTEQEYSRQDNFHLQLLKNVILHKYQWHFITHIHLPCRWNLPQWYPLYLSAESPLQSESWLHRISLNKCFAR